LGIAVRKGILRRRGGIRRAAVRAPGLKLDQLLGRLQRRLVDRGETRRLAVA
jgi:hypothetical protein